MAWWKSFTHKRPPEAELDSELQFHINALMNEKIAGGLSPDQARREASLEFGGSEQIKEELRDVHRIATIENTVANFKSGIRLMRKSPSFSAAVILTLALGIGANSAVFSAINAILLRPLPFPNADELVLLSEADSKARSSSTPVAPARLADWSRLNRTFQTMSGWYTQDVAEASGALPERVKVALVAPAFVEAWGVSPALGRDFSAAEEHFGGPNAVLISDRFWRRRFNADTGVIGKALRLDGSSNPIVGVLPASFRFPDHEVEIWEPSPLDAPYAQNRQATWFTVVGRLKPGVTVGQAKADLASVQSQLGKEFPKTDSTLTVEIAQLKESTVGGARRSLWLLFGSVSLLLLIACTNIASLLLARTTERQREISVRFSLGASRASVIVQLLTECLVLALAGSALGLVVAAVGAKALRTLGQSLPRVEEITLDWRIVAYTLGCAVLATLFCGLLPAIRGTRRSLAAELAHAGRTQVSTRNPLQWLLVGVQVMLAVVLLVGAGLLLRSFEELGRVSPGFEASHILTLRVSGNWGETVDQKKLTQRIDRTLEDLRTVPGVAGAATSVVIPGVPNDYPTELTLTEGRAESEGKIMAQSSFISNGYFATMKIPLLAGESCLASTNSTHVVVNRSFASRFLAGSAGMGRHLKIVGNGYVPAAEIRGMVADAREQGLNREPVPTVYWCISAPDPSPYFLIRTQGEPMLMAEQLRREIHTIEPARSVFDIAPLEERLSDSFAENRLRAILLSLFALTAVSLACIGLYGTLSYFVTLRKREVGLRLALGALRGQIVTHFLVKGFAVSAAGCVAGLGLAVAFARVLAGMLYGVSTADPKTVSTVMLLVLTVAFLSSLVPALRAARVEPMDVLRDE